MAVLSDCMIWLYTWLYHRTDYIAVLSDYIKADLLWDKSIISVTINKRLLNFINVIM